MYAGTMHEIHTARKEWRCDAGFTCEKARENPEHTKDSPKNVIKPGERYTDEVYPPWLMTQDDPDGNPFPLGEWIHNRFHVECYYPS